MATRFYLNDVTHDHVFLGATYDVNTGSATIRELLYPGDELTHLTIEWQ